MGSFDHEPGKPPAAPAGVAPSGAVLDELRQQLAHLSAGKLPVESIDPAAHMFDFGYLDSFRSAELLAFVERRWGLRVPELELVGRLSTLQALVSHIEAGGG